MKIKLIWFHFNNYYNFYEGYDQTDVVVESEELEYAEEDY